MQFIEAYSQELPAGAFPLVKSSSCRAVNKPHYTDNYAEQRGLEQIVYDKNPQAMASNGGLNKVRPISPKNKNRESYMDAANKHLEHDEGGS